MSAYGAIARPIALASTPLASTIWRTKYPNENVTIHHLTLTTSLQSPGLADYLHNVFTAVLEEGQTYPMEIADAGTYTRDAFQAYFFSADVLVAIKAPAGKESVQDGAEFQVTIDEARADRSWEDSVAGFYYVKPNYPGRSSHICNAGFIVPKIQQNNGYGWVMAKSYLHYAPRLGYLASVFNLVYVNNVASIRLWEKLNFTKAGRIPRAGRLRKRDGSGEEYVDAWVFYKSFVEEKVYDSL